MREQSVRDCLTGLFKRRYIEETLGRELSRAIRAKHSLGIIILDLDNLKRYNDSFGHAAGDSILSKLGSLLTEHVRSEDIPSRIGGDEFIIIMPDTTRKITKERAELFRVHISDFRSRSKGNFSKESQFPVVLQPSLRMAIAALQN